MPFRIKTWTIFLPILKFFGWPLTFYINRRKKAEEQRRLVDSLAVERDQTKNTAARLAQLLEATQKAKEKELRAKDDELQEKEGALRMREGELRVRNDELRISREDGQEKAHRIANLEVEVRDTTVRCNSLSRTLQDTQASLRQSENAISQNQRQIHSLQKALEQKTELLDTRSKELSAAQVFLGTQDAYTDTQVMHLVSDLNYEIQQAAVSLADVVVSVGEMDATPQRSIDPAVLEMAESIVGDRIIKNLQEANHAEDPLLLELAFQAVLASVSRVVATRWHFGPYPQDPFEGTFELLFLGGSSRSSLAWRRVWPMAFSVTQVCQRMEPAVHAFVTNLAYITTLAGFASASDAVEARLTASVGEKLNDIAVMALSLNKIVGEEVTSSVLSPTIVNPGCLFSTTAMEDAYSGENPAEEGARALCTTSLGLERRVKKDDGTVETTVLAKPKVALESIVAMLIRPEKDSDDESGDSDDESYISTLEQGDVLIAESPPAKVVPLEVEKTDTAHVTSPPVESDPLSPLSDTSTLFSPPPVFRDM
ncbi:hypothetical protein OF83DRAFT_1170470 [Amylostereum chailletii]|nr:hypothetical protein OF83DRAFT_1170470 [Amylostereum chailletii]